MSPNCHNVLACLKLLPPAPPPDQKVCRRDVMTGQNCQDSHRTSRITEGREEREAGNYGSLI